jgi:hypothetical protein
MASVWPSNAWTPELGTDASILFAANHERDAELAHCESVVSEQANRSRPPTQRLRRRKRRLSD